jgi:type I restriction enzyme S subunit
MIKPGFKQTEIGRIPEDWEVKKIEQIKSNKKHSMSMGPFGSNITKDNFVDEGVPVIRGNNLTDYRFKDEEFVFVTDSKANELKASLAYPNDIVVTHRGTLGQVGIIPQNSKYERYIVSQSGMKLTCDDSIAKPEFIFYFLKSPKGQFLLLQNTSQTGVPAIAQPLTTLKNILIPLPSLNEQRAIASILSSLDSKIALNRSMNSTLEGIGQTLFRRWFIDFEFPNEKGKPYKSSGGEMVHNEELGKEIPKGWRVGTLEDYIEFVKGKKPKEVSEEKIEGYLPQILIETLNGGNFSYANPTNLVTCNENDIIMVMDGASSGRVEIGFNGILGSTLAKIVCKNDNINQSYLYFILLNKQQEIKENPTGSAIPHADKKRVLASIIIIPDKKTLVKFQEFMTNLFNKIWLNKKEIKSLSQIRDALLPKLMSGEMRIEDAERFMGGRS